MTAEVCACSGSCGGRIQDPPLQFADLLGSPSGGSWLPAGKGFRKAVRLFGKRRRPRNGTKRCPKGGDEQSAVADDERGRTESKGE